MPKTASSSRQPQKNRDEISEHDISDVESKNGEIDEEITNETIIQMLLEQPSNLTSKKSLGRSRAFQSQKEAYYNEARKNSKELVRDGIAFLKEAQSKLTDLHTQEISFEKYYQDCHLSLTTQQESFEHAQTLYPPLLENLGLRRSAQVDVACNMLKKKGPQRQEALKEFSKHARAQVEQARQNEKDAADASALIRGYKALQQS